MHLRVVALALLASTVVNAQTTIETYTDSLIDKVPHRELTFKGVWSAYSYEVVYDNANEEVTTFQPLDTIDNIIFDELVGFPTKAFRIYSADTSENWHRLIINLPEGEEHYIAYWHGHDGIKSASRITAYDNIAVQFNVDLPDNSYVSNSNLFIEIVRE